MPDEHHGNSPNARFLAGTIPGTQAPLIRIRNAFSVSMLAHAAGFLFILLIVSRAPVSEPTSTPRPALPDGIVWIFEAGAGGGGGGGGSRSQAPPPAAEIPGPEKVTVPVVRAPIPAPMKKAPEPAAQLSIPAITTSAGLQEMPGVLTAVSVPLLGSCSFC